MSDLTEITRKLVAVLAADVEGYNRLMGADEVGTLRSLTDRRAILDRLIGEHRGRIANTAGDSVLAEFGSAVDAVQCAVAAQAALAAMVIARSMRKFTDGTRRVLSSLAREGQLARRLTKRRADEVIE